MAFYVDDEEVWKCEKHPSKRRKTGICPTCLRERLALLCRECHNPRPCACSSSAAAAAATSSSSSSSSFSLFGSRRVDRGGDGEIGPVSNLIDNEPSLRKSRSVAVPFFRSRFGSVRESVDKQKPPVPANRAKKSSFWSVFKSKKGGEKGGEGEGEGLKKNDAAADFDYEKIMMMRSRSVSVPVASNYNGSGSGSGGEFRSPSRRRWHFPSPFRSSSKVVQDRSPVYRG
ncbi:hypothetical protein RJ639_038529 [Escallonia herrerae]|uniref:Uncharacterized protein n=1 Tax=Escallonia herrerae TaxID=1293975 RepID=A0AA88WLC5_9ASTE|nr:hypothetical protein RJ639_038529 [Escallonia herrerae]